MVEMSGEAAVPSSQADFGREESPAQTGGSVGEKKGGIFQKLFGQRQVQTPTHEESSHFYIGKTEGEDLIGGGIPQIKERPSLMDIGPLPDIVPAPDRIGQRKISSIEDESEPVIGENGFGVKEEPQEPVIGENGFGVRSEVQEPVIGENGFGVKKPEESSGNVEQEDPIDEEFLETIGGIMNLPDEKARTAIKAAASKVALRENSEGKFGDLQDLERRKQEIYTALHLVYQHAQEARAIYRGAKMEEQNTSPSSGPSLKAE